MLSHYIYSGHSMMVMVHAVNVDSLDNSILTRYVDLVT